MDDVRSHDIFYLPPVIVFPQAGDEKKGLFRVRQPLIQKGCGFQPAALDFYPFKESAIGLLRQDREPPGGNCTGGDKSVQGP
jgi:hypothetical protein